MNLAAGAQLSAVALVSFEEDELEGVGSELHEPLLER